MFYKPLSYLDLYDGVGIQIFIKNTSIVFKRKIRWWNLWISKCKKT